MLTNEYILPAVSSEGQLPPNDAARDRLRRIAGELRTPAPHPPHSLPQIASEITGETYALQDNALEFSEFTFWFDRPDGGRLRVGHAAGMMELPFGADEVYRVSEGVAWGARTDSNQFALRGEWTGENDFTLEIHEVGEPFYFDATFTFQEDRLQSMFTWQPFNWKFNLDGAQLNP